MTPPARAVPALDLRRAVLTVAGACDLAAGELRRLSDECARGHYRPHLPALLRRYARVCDAAARELRDPVCRPPRQGGRPGACP